PSRRDDGKAVIIRGLALRRPPTTEIASPWETSMRRQWTRVALIVTSVVALAGLAPVAVAAPAVEPTAVVRVMTLNVFYGGDELDLRTGSWCHRPAGCA